MKYPLLSLALLMAPVAGAFEFTDEDEFPTWAEDAIEVVSEANIMTGFGDGSFGADQALTRAEAVTLILRTKPDIFMSNYNGTPQFPDVEDGAWYEDAVGVAAAYGWVKGHDDGYFYPGNTLTRAEFATMLDRTFELEVEDEDVATKFADVDSGFWFTPSVSAMLENDLIRNWLSVNYQPGKEVSRAEAAWIFAELVNRPGLIAESEAEISSTDPLDSRRVAIKPRDFNAEKQGYDIERAAIHVNVVPTETEAPIAFDLSSDWEQIGIVRFRNSFDYRADVESFRVRLRLDANDMGPEEGFLLKFEGAGLSFEEKVYSNGGLAITGLNHRLDPEEELVLRVFIKGDTEESFFPRTATGKVFLIEASGEAFKEFVSESRDTSVRVAPVEYEDRDFANFTFDPVLSDS